MQVLIVTLCFVGFGVALFFNIYFRVKVLKSYRTLVRNEVEFDKIHIFDRKKLEDEILPKYPQFKDEILGFVDGIRLSLTIGSICVVIITLMAASLIFFKPI